MGQSDWGKLVPTQIACCYVLCQHSLEAMAKGIFARSSATPKMARCEAQYSDWWHGITHWWQRHQRPVATRACEWGRFRKRQVHICECILFPSNTKVSIRDCCMFVHIYVMMYHELRYAIEYNDAFQCSLKYLQLVYCACEHNCTIRTCHKVSRWSTVCVRM